MSAAKVAAACGVCAVALSACGSTSKPAAGTIAPTATKVGHAAIDDPRAKHIACLLAQKIPAVKVGRTWVQIDSPPNGPVVNFLPTPGAAQEAQISAQVTGAEAIGSSLLYPKGDTSDAQLKTIEACMAEGVKG